MFKLIIFDVDNTLIKIKNHEYFWTLLASEFNLVSEDKELYDLWSENKINYQEWNQKVLKLYQEKEINEKKIIKIIKENTQIEKNTTKLLKYLKENNFKLAILSGSVKTLIKYYHLEKYFDIIILNNFIFSNKNNNLNKIQSTKFDGEKKINGLLHICKTLNVKVKQTIYIGDGNNDIPINNFLRKKGGFSISFNGSPKLNKISNKTLNGELYKLKELISKNG